MLPAVRTLLRQGPASSPSRFVPEGLPISAKTPIPKASPGWSPSATCCEGGEDSTALTARHGGRSGRALQERRR
jgi:hypothetical protein